MEFSPGNYDLSKLPKVAVEYLLKRIADARAAKKKEIEGKKPQQDRYFKTTNYRDDLDAWRANVAEVDSFFDAISAALNKRLAELTEFEDLRVDGISFKTAYRKSNERLKRKDEIEAQSAKNAEKGYEVPGYEEQTTIKDAERFIFEKFEIDAAYSKGKIPLDVANALNQELCRAFDVFGTVGIINSVAGDKSVEERGAFASYHRKTKTLCLRPRSGIVAATYYIAHGDFSTKSPLHGYRHEIGHAILYFCEESLDPTSRSEMIAELKQLKRDHFELNDDGEKELSVYAGNTYKELVSESVAQLLNGTPSPLALKVVSILTRGL